MEVNENNSIVDLILGLPLFQGITREQLKLLVERFPFHFLKYSADEPIVHDGESCRQVKFILTGAVDVITPLPASDIVVSHRLKAPDVLLADRLFGLDICYHGEVSAGGDCSIMQLEKKDFFAMLQSSEVVLLNLLNMLSFRAQQPSIYLRDIDTMGVEQRLATLVSTTTTRQSTDIVVAGSRMALATLLGSSRAQQHEALARLSNKGVISVDGNEIAVNNRQALLNYLKK